MSRKLLATVAVFLAVLLPVRGFAAHFIAACDMSPTSNASAATAKAAKPCHEINHRNMMHQADAAAHENSSPIDEDQAAANEACGVHCSACAASCSAPLVMPGVQATRLDISPSPSLPALGCSYQSALLARADKPPVL